jgi:hypothetical protein
MRQSDQKTSQKEQVQKSSHRHTSKALYNTPGIKNAAFRVYIYTGVRINAD